MKGKLFIKHRKILSVFTVLTLLISSLAACVPVFAEATEIISYQLPSTPGEFVYADAANGRYFLLEDDKLTVFDAESGDHNLFYDFRANSQYPASFKYYDHYYLGNMLYYLYQCGENSYVIVVDFSRLTVMVNTLRFSCTAVMATSSGEVLVYTPLNGGVVYVVKGSGNYSDYKINSSIDKFYGEDINGNIYYTVNNGVTFAKYNGTSFTPTNRRLTDITMNLSDHHYPVEIFNKRYIADYTGTLCSLSDGSTEVLFRFNRDNYKDIGYQGFGTSMIFMTGTNYVIGMSNNDMLVAVNLRTGQQESAVTTSHNIYAITQFGTRILCFEKDSTGSYCEIFSLADFMQIEHEVFDLNDQSVYAGRTSADIALRYSSAIGNVDLDDPMLDDPGSEKAPYEQSVMSDKAQQTLLDFSNYQRWLAGLSSCSTGDSSVMEMAAKGAILSAASSVQGHYPPKPDDMDDDFYEIGYQGTGGNLSYGHENTIKGGITAIRGLTDDVLNLSNKESTSENGQFYQGYNTPGHRNTFLQRGANHLTYGAANEILLQYFEYAQSDPNKSGTFTETDNNQNAYAWPSPGAFPCDEIDKDAVWTVYLNTDVINTGSKNLSIIITDLDTNETFVRNTVMHDIDGYREGYSITNYWGKSISFTPPKASSFAGKSYRVTIDNLFDSRGLPAIITYTINMFEYEGTYDIDGTEYSMDSDGKLVAVNPTTEVPTTEAPTTEEPTTEEPTTEEPTTEEPTTEEPTTEEPTTEVPTMAEPSTAEPTVTEQPTTVPKVTSLTTLQPTTEQPTTGGSPGAVTFLCGDINSDGKVNGADAGILSRYASGQKGMEQRIKNWDAADLNRDGKVNGADAGILSRYASGWARYASYIIEITV